MANFNWANLIQMIPLVILGIQTIHQDAAGATKKQIALEALGLATGVANQVLAPDQAAMANAASGLIDNFVNLFHATNAPGFGTNAPKP